MEEKLAYRFYRLDPQDKIVAGRDDLECKDDAAAIAKAILLSQTNAYEVWRGTRLIAHIEPRRKAG